MKHVTTRKELETYLMSLSGVRLEHPFGEEVAVYMAPGEKMFALIREGSMPLQLSLKCDPQLAQVLREKYETVMPGHHLHKKEWNTILLTGQLTWQEVQDLIMHAYVLVTS